VKRDEGIKEMIFSLSVTWLTHNIASSEKNSIT